MMTSDSTTEVFDTTQKLDREILRYRVTDSEWSKTICAEIFILIVLKCYKLHRRIEMWDIESNVRRSHSWLSEGHLKINICFSIRNSHFDPGF